ncbi:isochorismatase family protein [Chloroflexota bacterium]
MSLTSFSKIKDSWAIEVKNTALVVIDMQRAFVDQGAPVECVGARKLVPKINELAATCRTLKIPVIFVKVNRRADLSDSDFMKDLNPKLTVGEMEPWEGEKGAEFCPGLDVHKDDYIVPKIRYSALIPGSSSLEPLFRGLGRDSLIICGVATDVCVGTTTMDAMMLGFKVFFVGDLTATFSEERQKIALEVYDTHFAKVMTFDEVMKELAQLKSGQ